MYREIITSLFDQNEWKYSVDSDGDYVLVFRDFFLWMIPPKEQNFVIAMRATLSRPKETGPEFAVEFSRFWSKDHRWPKICISDRDELTFECDLPLQVDCSEEYLLYWLETQLMAVYECVSQLHLAKQVGMDLTNHLVIDHTPSNGGELT